MQHPLMPTRRLGPVSRSLLVCKARGTELDSCSSPKTVRLLTWFKVAVVSLISSTVEKKKKIITASPEEEVSAFHVWVEEEYNINEDLSLV